MSFRERAQKSTVLAAIMEGRDKGDVAMLIDYKAPVSLIDFEPMVLANEDGEAEQVYAFTLKEFPNHFFFGGFVMRKIFEDWESAYENHEACIKDYKACDPVQLQFTKGKTKAGKPITLVKVI